jgi:hypothetical protein
MLRFGFLFFVTDFGILRVRASLARLVFLLVGGRASASQSSVEALLFSILGASVELDQS